MAWRLIITITCQLGDSKSVVNRVTKTATVTADV